MKTKNYFLIFLLFILLIGTFYYLFFYYPEIKKKRQEEINNARALIKKILIKEILINPLLINFESVSEINTKLPLRYNLSLVKNIIKKSLRNNNLKIESKEINTEKNEHIILNIFYKNTLVYKVRMLRSKKPKIAIIIDDWGYNDKYFNYLEKIKYPVNIAILPGHKYSEKAAQKAYLNKKSVLLHLPMEPKKNMPLEKNTIRTDMSEGEIKYIFDNCIKKIPYIIGVNNHEGSKTTENIRVMRILMQKIKDNELFFIDSKTSDYSVATKAAIEKKVRYGVRDVFLDNKKEKEYIKGQFNLLKKIARKKGSAIGICHYDLGTLEILCEIMPEIEKQGFEFVYASELLR